MDRTETLAIMSVLKAAYPSYYRDMKRAPIIQRQGDNRRGDGFRLRAIFSVYVYINVSVYVYVSVYVNVYIKVFWVLLFKGWVFWVFVFWFAFLWASATLPVFPLLFDVFIVCGIVSVDLGPKNDKRNFLCPFQGRENTRGYTDRDGNDRQVTELIVSQAHFCGPKGGGSNQPSGGYPENQFDELTGDDGELPF